jgi:hypothetical protein
MFILFIMNLSKCYNNILQQLLYKYITYFQHEFSLSLRTI